MNEVNTSESIFMTEFDNKVAVITGGANGIGKCIVEEFRKNGAKVCIIDNISFYC